MPSLRQTSIVVDKLQSLKVYLKSTLKDQTLTWYYVDTSWQLMSPVLFLSCPIASLSELVFSLVATCSCSLIYYTKMHTLYTLLTVATALEFLFIMYLETFATTSAKTAKVFNLEQSELQRPALNTLFKNQGVYNGLLGLALLYSLFCLGPETSRLFLVIMVLVAVYGAVSSQVSILWKQGGLPFLALVASLL